MSDPDMFLNYTPTSAVSDAGKQAQLGGTARQAFPDSVHIPEGVHKAIKRIDCDFASVSHDLPPHTLRLGKLAHQHDTWF